MSYCDSTGKPIQEGDRVRFRGKEYTIDHFQFGKGAGNTAAIFFWEKQHTEEIACETSVDRI